MGLVSESCREYVAGCNRDLKDQCYEALIDHVKKMIEIYRSLDNNIRSVITTVYKDDYLTSIKEKTGSGGIYDIELARCDPVEITIIFHDLGKCTENNQKSLRSDCVAPNHEIISAASLYAFSISNYSGPGLLVSLPHIIAILLHHHAMRSIKDLIRKIYENNLSLLGKNDSQNIERCLHILLKETSTCSDLLKSVSRTQWAFKIREHINNMIELITRLDEKIDENPYYSIAYRIAVMIVGLVSVLDRYVAVINRSCGHVSESDLDRLDRDVAEYLRRREAFRKASEILLRRGF